jgi:phosphoserine phosphatase
MKPSIEERNFGIYAVHPIYRRTVDTHFKGTLPEAKLKAREILGAQKEPGWKVIVCSDGCIIYAEIAG